MIYRKAKEQRTSSAAHRSTKNDLLHTVEAAIDPVSDLIEILDSWAYATPPTPCFFVLDSDVCVGSAGAAGFGGNFRLPGAGGATSRGARTS